MATLPFLDTNVFLRHLLQDDLDQAARATALFGQVERTELAVRISDTIVFEVVFVLQSVYRLPRELIRDDLLPLIQLSGVTLPNKELFEDVFDLYLKRRGLNFADCYHAVLAPHLGSTEIISFDRGFDRVPGITRTEPPALGSA